jgi:nicotinamidase-related amidase
MSRASGGHSVVAANWIGLCTRLALSTPRRLVDDELVHAERQRASGQPEGVPSKDDRRSRGARAAPSPRAPTDSFTRPDLRAAALVTIDTQVDVLDGGGLEVPGTSQVLGPITRLLHEFRRTGKPIVHAVRLYRADGSNVDPCRRLEVERGGGAFLAGSAGSQLARELLPDAGTSLDSELLLRGGLQPLAGDEVVMYKPRWGAFFETPLHRHLQARGVTTLVVCGCNFPNCPRTSIYEASERDYRLILVRDAVSGIYPRGEDELRAIGVQLTDTAELIAAVAAAVAATRQILQDRL